MLKIKNPEIQRGTTAAKTFGVEISTSFYSIEKLLAQVNFIIHVLLLHLLHPHPPTTHTKKTTVKNTTHTDEHQHHRFLIGLSPY